MSQEKQTSQEDYYKQTAQAYDSMHLAGNDEEHDFALSWLAGIVDYYSVQTMLDVGSGTGRAIRSLNIKKPDLAIIGIEPVDEMRRIGHKNGIPKNLLINGDATCLEFANNEFDMCCAFGTLHHIKNPTKAIEEMLRVSKIGIFISDSNNFGQGNSFVRPIKHALNRLSLWKAFDFFATAGKGYKYSKEDGVFYSYSVFNDFKLIRKNCSSIHLMNTKNAGKNLYKTASHIALLGLK